MLEKSPEAFKTISEAAEELGVEQHVLRFWETKFPQIKPLKRRGGRRYYRPEDMEVLHRIRHLLYQQGFTIKGAKKALSSKEPVPAAAPAAEPAPVQPVKTAAAPNGGQFDLLAPAQQPAGLNANQRKALENVLTTLKAARKGLQSAT